MKKFSFIIVVAVALAMASCGKKMSPAAQKAWNDFKACAEKVDSEEKVDKFESMEAFNQAMQDWSKAAQAMEANAAEYSKEITDSMEAITNKVKPVMEKIQKVVAEGVAAGLAEAAAEEADAEADDEE